MYQNLFECLVRIKWINDPVQMGNHMNPTLTHKFPFDHGRARYIRGFVRIVGRRLSPLSKATACQIGLVQNGLCGAVLFFFLLSSFWLSFVRRYRFLHRAYRIFQSCSKFYDLRQHQLVHHQHQNRTVSMSVRCEQCCYITDQISFVLG